MRKVLWYSVCLLALVLASAGVRAIQENRDLAPPSMALATEAVPDFHLPPSKSKFPSLAATRYQQLQSKAGVLVFGAVDAGIDPRPPVELLTSLTHEEALMFETWRTDSPAMLIALTEQDFRNAPEDRRAAAHESYRKSLNIAAKLALPEPSASDELVAAQGKFFHVV